MFDLKLRFDCLMTDRCAMGGVRHGPCDWGIMHLVVSVNKRARVLRSSLDVRPGISRAALEVNIREPQGQDPLSRINGCAMDPQGRHLKSKCYSGTKFGWACISIKLMYILSPGLGMQKCGNSNFSVILQLQFVSLFCYCHNDKVTLLTLLIA